MANETFKESEFNSVKSSVSANTSDVATLKNDMADIKPLVIKTQNISFSEAHYYIAANGNAVSNQSDLAATPFISVNPGDVITYHVKVGSSWTALACYDANKNFISSQSVTADGETSGTKTIASGTAYVRLCSWTNSLTPSASVKNSPLNDIPGMKQDIATNASKISQAVIAEAETKNKWLDIASNLAYSNILGTGTRTVESDGVRFTDGSDGDSNYWVALGIVLPKNFVLGHKYFIALNIQLVEDTTAPTSGSTQGNKTFDSIDLRTNWGANTVITATKQTLNAIITKGNTSTLKWAFTVADSSANQGAQIRLQFGSYKAGNSIEYKVKGVCVIDMTALGMTSVSDAETAFAEYGYNHADVVEKIYNIKVKSAETADNASGGGASSLGTIEIWGDSLVGQGYGTTYLAPMLGRTVITKGYGGKKSPYIRDQFLEQANTDNTIIINVGRNNKDCMDEVVQDVRKMVAAIPHNRFLICCPPNGNYGEGKGTTSYNQLDTIRERLRTQYQENFLDTWGASIQEYDMGGVTLSSSFVKPAVGEEVNISVSNGEFLTTYNSNDVTRWGDDYMQQIVIGQSIDAVDVYKVVGRYGNTLRCQLVTSGSTFAVGATVQNGTDDGGTSSVRYLRVLQYADWDCWKKDIGQSTFRADGIHMSAAGQQCLAKIIARKIKLMGI